MTLHCPVDKAQGQVFSYANCLKITSPISEPDKHSCHTNESCTIYVLTWDLLYTGGVRHLNCKDLVEKVARYLHKTTSTQMMIAMIKPWLT